jgi:hypothetical protein
MADHQCPGCYHVTLATAPTGTRVSCPDCGRYFLRLGREWRPDHPGIKYFFAEAIRDSIVDNFDRSVIRPGYYSGRYGTDKMLVEARIYLRDHEPGNPENKLDGPPVLAGEILGEYCDPVLVWTLSDRRPMRVPQGYTAAGWYAYRSHLADWTKVNAPEEPLARPYRRVDLTSLPPIPPPGRKI